jgi:hypothetical protein
MRAQGSSRMLWVHRTLASGLLALLLGFHFGPLVNVLLPASVDQCGCPKSSKPCCCEKTRRLAQAGSALWFSSSRCGGTCRGAAVFSFHFNLLPAPANAHRYELAATDGRPVSIASLIDHNSCYLAFLYQRPPPDQS